MELIITDNIAEKLTIKSDEERVSLIQENKGSFPEWRAKNVIILNPREATEASSFITDWKWDLIKKGG